MYEFLNRDSRGMRWAVFGLWASWIVTGLGCGGGGPTTGVDLTVESDDLLMLDTIDVAMRAIGKDEHHVNQPAARTVRVRIVTDGLGTGAVVNLDVTGVKNQKAAVVARAQAIVMRGSVVPITVRLTQACAGVLTCPATETCSGGRCIPIPQMGDTGMSGTGTGGAVGTGGAIGTGGIPGTGGTSTGTGGGVSATGGIGTSGSGGATGGASGSPATGGGPGTGGSGSGGSAAGGNGSGGRSGGAGAATGGAGTGGAATGGRGAPMATGGRGDSSTGGAASGGMGTGGANTGGAAPVCTAPNMTCGSACAALQTDANNCGTCGRSCLGGTCAEGQCQPFLLASPNVGSAREITISGSTLYLHYEFNGRVPGVYSMSATAPSNPATLTGIPGQDQPFACSMAGKLYWAGLGEQALTVQSCTLDNCAATTALVTPIAEMMAVGPVCDTATNELAWLTYSSTTVTRYTIYRSSPTGTNVRSITAFTLDDRDGGFSELLYGYRLFSNGRADRVFFQKSAAPPASMSTLFTVSTVSPNTSPVSLATFPGSIYRGSGAVIIANDTSVIASTLGPNGSPLSVFRAPLPNGVTSGAPPSWLSGGAEAGLEGVADASYFYGVTHASASVPPDAVFRCSMTGPCTNPTILFRGYERAGVFAQDTQAFYWTTANVAAGQGFSVWKAAK